MKNKTIIEPTNLEKEIVSELRRIKGLRFDVGTAKELDAKFDDKEEWYFGLACQGELLEISRNANHFLVRYYAAIAYDHSSSLHSYWTLDDYAKKYERRINKLVESLDNNEKQSKALTEINLILRLAKIDFYFDPFYKMLKPQLEDRITKQDIVLLSDERIMLHFYEYSSRLQIRSIAGQALGYSTLRHVYEESKRGAKKVLGKV